MEAAQAVNRSSAASPSYRQIDLSSAERPRVVYESQTGRAEQILGAIADAAIDLLTGPDRERIKVCPAPSCGMFYLAGKGDQQWCSASCGNRARVARHYLRSRAQVRERRGD